MTANLKKKKKRCDKCGAEKEMYYTLWCPRCDKPVRKTTTVLNVNKALRHVEVVADDPNFSERVWDYLCAMGIVHNDTVTGIGIEWDMLDEAGYQGLEEQERLDFMLLRDTFDITEDENLQFEFSW